MDFRVYVIIEAPILGKVYEILVPVDRRIHELISALKKTIPELSQNYYQNHSPKIYSKSSGEVFDMNLIIKNTNIKTGTRLILL